MIKMYEPTLLNENESKELISIAKDTLEKFVRHEHVTKPGIHDQKLDEKFGIVCTIYKDNKIKGESAVGVSFPFLSLSEAVMEGVQSAATQGSLQASDLSEVKVEISIITQPTKLEGPEKFTPSEGLLLKYSMYEAFLLPQAQKRFASKEEFLDELCTRAGLTKGMWKEHGIELYKFNAQVISE